MRTELYRWMTTVSERRNAALWTSSVATVSRRPNSPRKSSAYWSSGSESQAQLAEREDSVEERPEISQNILL